MLERTNKLPKTDSIKTPTGVTQIYSLPKSRFGGILDPILKPIFGLFSGFTPMTRKIIIIGLSALCIFVVIIFIAVLVLGLKRGGFIGGGVKPTPRPGANITIPPLIPSKYATDTKVLSIETNLDEIEKQLDQVDMREVYLTLPRIEYNIDFSK